MSEAASNSISNTPSVPARAWSIISWGAFLACSWTWCIGMWLPVILLRDFGIWSFAAFAIPNVIGAAAMGVVLQRRGLSEWITTEHRFAARAFSAVTIVFQLFFMLWFLGGDSARKGTWPWYAVVLSGLFALVAFHFGSRWIRQISLGVWVLSLLLLLWSLRSESLSVQSLPPAVLDPGELLWLMPVLAFGFLLCPYLDLTFHRARQSLPGRAGSAAFVIGFGVMFLAMILGTLGYGLALLRDHAAPLSTLLPLLLAAHIVIQLAFTIAAHHFDEKGRDQDPVTPLQWPRDYSTSPMAAISFSILMLLGFVVVGRSHGVTYAGLTATEIVYRGFMSFYGLIFPAYVWLCMLPLGTTRTPRRVWTFVAAVVLASPFYWMGFIERETIWLVPGVAIVLFAKLIAGGAPRRSA